MNAGSRSWTALWLGLLAFAGLVTGHWISYLVVAPDAHARRDLLRVTGHGSHDLIITLGIAAAVAAVIGFVGGQVRAYRASMPDGYRILPTAFGLWVLQTTGFVVLELSERAHGFHDIAAVLAEPTLLWGLAAQALVAVAASLILLLLRKTVAAICGLLPSLPSNGAQLPTGFISHVSPKIRLARSAWNLRGPPIAVGNHS